MSNTDRLQETESDFTKATNYQNRDLRGWDFQNAQLEQANFEKANCQEANFRGANLRFTEAKESNFICVDFTEASISNCNFVASDLRGACFRRAYLRCFLLVGGRPRDPHFCDSANMDFTNFYQCDIPFNALRIGVLRQWQSSFGPIGLITPKMAEWLACAANTLATPTANQEESDRHLAILQDIQACWPLLRWTLEDTAVEIERHRELYGLYWQQKQRQVKRVMEEISGSVEALAGREAVLKPSCWLSHLKEWLPVLALPDMGAIPELSGRSLLSQALNILLERRHVQPYSPQEKARLMLQRPTIDEENEFCDAGNRLKEIYVDRWLSWLDEHPEKESLIKTTFVFCHEADDDNDSVYKGDRAYTREVLLDRYPELTVSGN
ncbi:MAG: pentapeptide repeat-containing protein [Cyanobacteria bacterium P01_E01_bin.42]